MTDFNLMRELRREAAGKIILLVLDGLGGLPLEPGGPTELEAARTPNLDRLASGGHPGSDDPHPPRPDPRIGTRPSGAVRLRPA